MCHIAQRSRWFAGGGSRNKFSPTGHELAPKPAAQHAPTVTGKFEEKNGGCLKRPFFGFLPARKSLSQNLQKIV